MRSDLFLGGSVKKCILAIACLQAVPSGGIGTNHAVFAIPIAYPSRTEELTVAQCEVIAAELELTVTNCSLSDGNGPVLGGDLRLVQLGFGQLNIAGHRANLGLAHLGAADSDITAGRCQSQLASLWDGIP